LTKTTPQETVTVLRRLAEQGDATAELQKDCAELKDTLEKTMTPAQIADAERRAQEWTAAFGKRKKG
jgi:hypothetical protein